MLNGMGAVRMKRRCIALVGMTALALAYLPAVVGAFNASTLVTCCAGMLCPMHHMSAGHVTCDTDPAHRSTTCEACAPHQTLPYTAGAVFNRVTSAPVTSELPAGTAPVLFQIAAPNVEREVLSPPPRLILS